MSIAILSIPLGIISIIVFIWAINQTSEKPAKGKKKDNDTTIIGVIVSVILLFVSLGIYDGKESTAGLFASDNTAQEESSRRDRERNSTKSEAQREVEEHNKSTAENAHSRDDKPNSKDNGNSNKSDNHENFNTSDNRKNINETTKAEDADQNKNLEKQQNAYQEWYNQVETKIQTIENIWTALWNDNSPENINKLIKALETEKTQLIEIKVPEELSATHRQKLMESMDRYSKWIDFHIQACQTKLQNINSPDITGKIAQGDGLKLQSNVEISNVGRELGISNP